MNLQQLKYFVTLAQIQNYTHAAKTLHISQPSLHIAMTRLEEELQAKLFDKKGRNIYLTKLGQEFLTYVESSLLTLENGMREIHHLQALETGRVDLGYVSTVSSYVIPELTKQYLTSYPKTRFSYSVLSTLQIIEGIRTGHLDIGFGFYYPFIDDLTFERLAPQEMVVVVAKDHPLAKYDSIDLSHLNKLPFIMYTPESWARVTVEHILQEYHIAPNQISELPDENAICGLVNQNIGVSIIVNNLKLRFYENIKAIKIENPINTRYLNVIYSKKRQLNTAGQNFLDYVRESYGTNSP